MQKETKKLKLNIKGRFQKPWVDHILKNKIKAIGLKVDEIKHHTTNHSEVVVIGERFKLWKVINWSKKPIFFVRLDQVVFEFCD